MAEFDLSQPQSRMEKILGTIAKTYSGSLDEPQSRVEAYLNEVAEVVATKSDLDTNKQNYSTVIVNSTSDLIGKTLVFRHGSTDEVSSYVTGNKMTVYLPTTGLWNVYVDGIGIKTFTANKHSVEINLVGIIKYGYEVHPSIDTPEDKVTYLADCDNANFKPFKMNFTSGVPDFGGWKDSFFMPRSCMLRSNGKVAYYLNEDDETKKADGTDSDVANKDFDGNAMVEFGSPDGHIIWHKIVPTTDDALGYKVYVSNYKLDADYHAWAFHNLNSKIVKHFYLPKYNTSLIDGKFRSLSGQSIVGKGTEIAGVDGGKPTIKDGTAYNATQEMTYAKANGTGWLTETKAQVDLVNILLILMAKSTNSQTVYGNGYVNNTWKSTLLLDTGTANTKGMFYGTSGNVCVKVFGMEHWWGNQWRRYAGHMMINGVQKVKLTYGTEDGSTVVGYNTTGNGYITIDGATLLNEKGETSGNGYLKEMKASINGTLVPTGTLNGSSSTNYCDGVWYNNTTTIYALRGGSLSSGATCGVSYVDLCRSPGNAGWNICAGISYTPSTGDAEENYEFPDAA